jgi:hypothetical protein
MTLKPEPAGCSASTVARSVNVALWHDDFLIALASAPADLMLAHVWRARISSDVSEIKLVFSIPPHRPTPNFRAELECRAH